MKTILIIEDDVAMAATLEEYLGGDYNIHLVRSGQEALEHLKQSRYHAALLDLNLPDMHGFDILKHLEKHDMGCAVIVITGEASMSAAIEAMQLGAHDFVPKPVSQERLKVSLHNALENVELKEIAESFEKISRTNFQDFVGKSPKMQAVYSVLENAAQSKASVFITGESGTGKELAARAVHNLSTRNGQSLEVLNCAAIPHNLLESEIFGHVKGAFTGATTDRVGAATRADGGTLFLDELGEMPIALQSKLLRFIQLGTFLPVGDVKEQEVDIRFICATNRDPLGAVKDGMLREDLYYRLNVIPVHIPPLRERGEDIMILAQHFLEEVAQEEDKNFKSFSNDVRDVFLNYPWVGNVRELENTIRRIVVLNKGDRVEIDMLSVLKQGRQNSSERGIAGHAYDSDDIETSRLFLPKTKDDIQSLGFYEKEIILAALDACNGNITQASKYLDINPATIHRKQKLWREEEPGAA